MYELTGRTAAAAGPPRAEAPSPQLRICMLAACPFPANYGTPGSIREMAEAVCDEGHEVDVITYPTGEDIAVRGPRVYRVGSDTRGSGVTVGPTLRRPLYDLQLALKAIEVTRRNGPDLIHAHGYEAVLAAWVCARATGLPVVCSGHHTMADELPSYRFIRPVWLARGLARLLDAFVPRLADRCIPHSTNMAGFFHRIGLRGRSGAVVNFGINLQGLPPGDGAAVRRRHGLGADPVVLYAGLLDEFQRLDLLLEAMAVVARSSPRARLLVVVNVANPGQLAGLRESAARLGLTDRLVVTDPQPLPALWDYLAACDVAVVPRPQVPGFPIKLLNYMAARRASVLFASSAGRDLVDREAALLVAPDSGKALGQAVLRVLTDDGLRARLERNAYRFVQEHHDRRVVARQLCEFYLRTLAACRVSRSSQVRAVATEVGPQRSTRTGLCPAEA